MKSGAPWKRPAMLMHFSRSPAVSARDLSAQAEACAKSAAPRFVDALLDQGRDTALADAPLETRLKAIQILAYDDFERVREALAVLLPPNQPQEIQRAAVTALGSFSAPDVAELLHAGGVGRLPNLGQPLSWLSGEEPYRAVRAKQLFCRANGHRKIHLAGNRWNLGSHRSGDRRSFGEEYDDAADPTRITRVVDPFGRFTALQYNPAGLLSRLTDMSLRRRRKSLPKRLLSVGQLERSRRCKRPGGIFAHPRRHIHSLGLEALGHALWSDGFVLPKAYLQSQMKNSHNSFKRELYVSSGAAGPHRLRPGRAGRAWSRRPRLETEFRESQHCQ
jgi:YD repeat-containing protein